MHTLSTIVKYALLVVWVAVLFVAHATAQHLRIYHIDVEQADATLVVAPSGKTLLIDSGRNGDGTRIRNVMQHAGVTRIDRFVNTHYHADHYGGIDDLVNGGIQVDSVYDRGDKGFLPSSKIGEATYRDYQTAVGHRARHLMRGETISFDPEVAVLCIASGGTVLGEVNPSHGKDENDMSIALLIQYGAFRYFIGGDIEKHTEQKIADLDAVLDVDVYQANHHGSETSSSSDFMKDIKPAVIVISNGNNSIYRHPRRATLDFFATLQPRPTVYQTNKYLKGKDGGNVPDAFIADTESADDDGTILLTVNKGAGTYTVSYGATTHSYRIKGGATPSVNVVIESLLPNPVGDDLHNEEVSLRNKGATAVSLANWFLQDASGRVWLLSHIGIIPPGQSVTVRRNGMPMNLNNNGDEITLYDDRRQAQDRFRYTTSQEGVRILTGH
jgi:beta-lactamase superfamily II metal-dependent hydrolase